MIRAMWGDLVAWSMRRAAVGVALFAACAAASAVEVAAFNTYEHPPFVQETGRGFVAELLRYLNERLPAGQRLRQEDVPRERLMRRHLARPQDFDAVLLLLAPAFVDDPSRSQYLWTETLLFDQNGVVVRDDLGREPRQLDDLKGLRFGGVLGNRYAGIERLAEQGLIRRDDANGPVSSLRKLCAGRIDFTQLSRSVFDALAESSGCATRLRHLPLAESAVFERRIGVGRRNRALFEALQRLVAEMPCDPDWQAIVARYQLVAPRCARPAGR